MMLEWSERFQVHCARLPVGELVVSWQSGGYTVSVFGRRLKEPSPDAAHGKRRAIAAARKMLAETDALLA